MDNIHQFFEPLTEDERKYIKNDILKLIENTEEFKRIIRYCFSLANPIAPSFISNRDTLQAAKIEGAAEWSRVLLKHIIEANKPINEEIQRKQKTKIIKY